MIETILGILTTIYDLAEAHPDITKRLAAEALSLLSGHSPETLSNVEIQRALSSGIAAARANAVQEALRRHPTGSP